MRYFQFQLQDSPNRYNRMVGVNSQMGCSSSGPEYGNSTYTTPFLISFNNHCAWIKSYLRHLDIIFEFGIIPSKTSFGIKISELNKSLTLWIYAIGY